MDDVLECLLENWIPVLNSRFGRNVSIDDIRVWNISTYFPGLTDDDLYQPLGEDSFWKTLVAKPNASYYLKKLIDDGHQIYVVTATHYKGAPAKFEWLLSNFPFLSWKQVIITSNKQIIKADVLVDDAPHNLINGDYEKILFTAPHNRDYDESIIDAVRADSWEIVYELISLMASKE